MEKKPGLGKSTFWYSVGNLFSRSVGIILLPLYSNLITAEDFGIYSLLMAVYAFTSVFYQSSLHNAFLKFFSETDQPVKRKIIFSSTLNIALIAGIILTVTGIYFSEQLSVIILGTTIHKNLVRILFIILFIDNIAFFFLQLLKAEERSGYASAIVLISSSVNLLLNIVFVLTLGRGITGIFEAQLLSGGVLILIVGKELLSHYVPVIDKEIFFKSVRFIYPLIIAGLLTSAVDFIDRFIIDMFLGREEVGVYSFSYRVALVMNLFVISLRSAWIPYALRVYKNPDYPRLLGKSFTKILSVCALIFLAVTIFADDIFSLKSGNIQLVHPAYQPGIKIIPLILVSYAFSSMLTFFSAAPYITGKSKHFLFGDLTGFILNISFNFLLIPKIGIMGAAAATLLSYAGAAFYMFLYSRKVIRIRYESGRLLLLTGISAVVFLLANFFESLFTDVILFTAALIFIYWYTGLNYKTLFK